MLCPSCQSGIDEDAEACFHCGMAVFALTRGTVLSGRYEVLSPLGRGGMGRVYKAFDRVMEEPVALKVLRSEFMRDPEMSRRFVSEIKLARRIGHRNVCRIHEYGEDGEIRYIVMELIEGVTLKEHLREGPLSPAAAYDVSIQVARGLNAVHELGIVHRDFKAANIMIDAQGVAKLVDFGIARHVSSDLTSPTAAGMIMCTPEYMSPEQVAGGPAGFHSDIYALGCVVYEVFTGHAPFRGPTAAATVYMHVHDALPLDDEDARRIPPPLVPILERALAKDPRERYESVADFFHALSAAGAAGGYTSVPRGGLHPPPGLATGGPAPGWLHRPAPRAWRLMLALVAVLVASLAVFSALRPTEPLPELAVMPSPEPSPILSPSPSLEAAGPREPEAIASPGPRPFRDVLTATPPAVPPRAAAPTITAPARVDLS